MDPEMYLIIGFLGFILGAWFASMIFFSTFKMKHHHWRQQQQLNILIKIAERNGVPRDELFNIGAENNKTL